MPSVVSEDLQITKAVFPSHKAVVSSNFYTCTQIFVMTQVEKFLNAQPSECLGCLVSIWLDEICTEALAHAQVSFAVIGCGCLQALKVAGVHLIMAKRGGQAHPPPSSPQNIFMCQVGLLISSSHHYKSVSHYKCKSFRKVILRERGRVSKCALLNTACFFFDIFFPS